MQQTRHLYALAVVATLVFTIGLATALEGVTPAAGASSEDGATPTLLPEGSDVPGRAGAEASALALVETLGGIALPPRADGEAATCPQRRTRVSWDPPGRAYRHGAHVEPIGPPPGPDTYSVNGIVLCEGSDWEYVGFQAAWDGARWRVNLVPYVDEGDHGHQTPSGPPAPPPSDPPALGFGSPWVGQWDPAIEPLAVYEPQLACTRGAQPAVAGFRDLVLEAYPATRDLGILRACDAPGRSEHKEGRAWDWGVDVHDPDERRAAEDLVAWLLARDEHGNRHAMARRLGVMYVIWDGHIWSSFRAADGWRPYAGPNAHTDHVHVSLNRAGAAGATTFWQDGPVRALLGRPVPVVPPPPGGGLGYTARPGGHSGTDHYADDGLDHDASPDGGDSGPRSEAPSDGGTGSPESGDDDLLPVPTTLPDPTPATTILPPTDLDTDLDAEDELGPITGVVPLPDEPAL